MSTSNPSWRVIGRGKGRASHASRKSAIVAVRRKGRADMPDLTPEGLQRRADLGDAMFQDMKRRIAEKDHPT